MATPGQPMFIRRPGPVAQLALWSVLSLALIIVDTRFHALDGVRLAIATTLFPIQRALRWPFDFGNDVADFFTRHHVLLSDNQTLRQTERHNNALLAELRSLRSENEELRKLAGLRQSPGYQPIAVEILSTPRDPFSRRVLVDKGANASFQTGWPVVDSQGLVGQLARVFPMQAEATLVTDRDQVVPVQIQRTGQRILLFGGGDYMEVRYVPTHSDIKPGDMLETSGIDRVYPAGLAVARVVRVARPADNPYARVDCQPVAGVEKSRMLMVLKPVSADSKP